MIERLKLVGWAGALVLLALHFDVWRGPRPGIWFGWLPEELAYRLLWMLGATAYLWMFTAWIWTDNEENE